MRLRYGARRMVAGGSRIAKFDQLTRHRLRLVPVAVTVTFRDLLQHLVRHLFVRHGSSRIAESDPRHGCVGQLGGSGCVPLWYQRNSCVWHSHSQVVRPAKRLSMLLGWCAQRQWCCRSVRTLVARVELRVIRRAAAHDRHVAAGRADQAGHRDTHR